jgi:hypothetical protein
MKGFANQDTQVQQEEEIPEPRLEHLKPFGAGLKRGKISFVRATQNEPDIVSQRLDAVSTDISSFYKSLVFPNDTKQNAKDEESTEPSVNEANICPICNTTIVDEALHALSIAHQSALPHTMPPHAYDRTRHGLRYLESYGWDPDSRVGLGASGDGIRHPIKDNLKVDNLGVGAKIHKTNTTDRIVKLDKKPLGAKDVRKKTLADKRKAEKLQQHFWGNSEVEKYLGSSG